MSASQIFVFHITDEKQKTRKFVSVTYFSEEVNGMHNIMHIYVDIETGIVKNYRGDTSIIFDHEVKKNENGSFISNFYGEIEKCNQN